MPTILCVFLAAVLLGDARGLGAQAAQAAQTAPAAPPTTAPKAPPTNAPTPQITPRQVGTPVLTPSAIIEQIRAQSGVPGLVAGCVAKDGTVEFIEAAGVRRKGESAVLQATDRMHLGSCNKAITATLVATLVAEGKLKWESTLGQVLGATEPHMNGGWTDVTLEQLLRHRGGAPAGADPADWSKAWGCTDTPQKCRANFVSAVLARAPAQVPGNLVYSNQGFAIAGRMCEIATGDSYETLVTKRVFEPLGITHAGFGAPVKAVPESPSGHKDDGTPDNTDNPSAIAPAGTVHMPVGEWMKFIAFHLGATPPPALEGAAKQLSALHKAAAEDPHEAMGWFTTKRPWGGSVLTHNGSNNLWYCSVWLTPERGFAVMAASNQGGTAAAKACDDACAFMIEQHLQKQVIESARRPAPASPAPASPAPGN